MGRSEAYAPVGLDEDDGVERARGVCIDSQRVLENSRANTATREIAAAGCVCLHGNSSPTHRLGALDGCAPLGDCDDEPLKVDAQLIAQESAQERALSSHKEEARGMALIFAHSPTEHTASIM